MKENPEEEIEVVIAEVDDPGQPPPSTGQSGGAGSGGTGATTGGATTGGSTGATGTPPDPQQVLQQSWGSNMDPQTAQQFTGLSQVRQARANQLQREYTSLAKGYGPDDPGVQAVKASLTYQQTLGSRLGLVKTTTATTAPTAPAKGWVVYGRVRNADLTPAPQLTVFLADQSREWLQQYAYAFTDQTGYFTLTYDPAAGAAASEGRKTRQPQAAARSPLSAYLEVSNAACKLMHVDLTPMSLTAGASVYRDIVLDANVPLGSPPCQKGAAPTTPPAAKKS